ncbi:MAG: glutamate--tRNA ligase [Fibrobacter sp.]|nr:glutamate--tRNA ligase [Fibrobacter sp.]
MNTSKNPIRVRFAPSPTGYLHVGGARTALYNYLFAKANGGTFYLRVEDTDRKRFNEDALRDLFRDLRWLGLDWDEGAEQGGELGPYYQSERLNIYAEEVKRLLEDDKAYHCFCSEERLAEVRAAQEKSGQAVTGYDRHCRNISLSEAQQRLENGEKSVVRLKVPLDGTTVFHDQIRGEIVYQNTVLDDLVILKRDKFPTYHLASVVDDYYMQTSHVMRGDEWISSTPKHVLLYDALGWEAPIFCHLPVILAAGGGKLSKRHGAASVGDFRDLGYLPETLVNFLALLGWNPGDEREVMSKEELIECFSIDRISPTSAAFDEKKLLWMNGQHIRLSDDSLLLEKLKEDLPEIVPEESLEGVSNAKLLHIVQVLKSRINFLNDLAPMAAYFFVAPQEYDEKAAKRAFREGSLEVSELIINALEELDSFETEVVEGAFKKVCETHNRKLGQLVHPIRVAVSGTGVGPGLFELLSLVGQKEVIARIKKAQPLMQ